MHTDPHRFGARRTRHLSVVVLIGAAAGIPVITQGLTAFGLLVGWDVAAAVYLAQLS